MLPLSSGSRHKHAECGSCEGPSWSLIMEFSLRVETRDVHDDESVGTIHDDERKACMVLLLYSTQ